MTRRKWEVVHKELTRLRVTGILCGSYEIEVWLMLKVKKKRDGTYKGCVFAKSISDDSVHQVYPIDYIRAKHGGTKLVTALDKYGINS
jgi:hypothetical protein